MIRMPRLYAEPVSVRRKLVVAYREMAKDRKYKPHERAEFARIADRWERTLPVKPPRLSK